MKVGRYAFFNDAVFDGPVDFVLADIAGTFAAQQAKFQNKEKKANFTSMKVGDNAVFDSAVLEGEANLGSMKVGGDASFIGTVCDGPVTFTGAAIKGNFAAQGDQVSEQGKGSQLQRHESGRRRLFQQCGVRRTGDVSPGRYHRQFYGGEGKVSGQGNGGQLQRHESRRPRLFRRHSIPRAGLLRLGRRRRQFYRGEGKVSGQGNGGQLHRHKSWRRCLFQRCSV